MITNLKQYVVLTSDEPKKHDYTTYFFYKGAKVEAQFSGDDFTEKEIESIKGSIEFIDCVCEDYTPGEYQQDLDHHHNKVTYAKEMLLNAILKEHDLFRNEFVEMIFDKGFRGVHNENAVRATINVFEESIPLIRAAINSYQV